MSKFSLSKWRKAVTPSAGSNEILFERLPLNEGDKIDSELVKSATAFWFANRQTEGPPDWSCFKPEQHPALLANIILYERLEGGRYVTRLVGEAITDYLPVNPVGKFLDEVLPTDRLADVTMRLDRTFADGLPNYVEKARVWQHNDLTFDYNALSMPFISREAGLERVLCILEFKLDRLDS